MTEVCGQEILVPNDPSKVQCYSDAGDWLVEQCALCGGNAVCEGGIRALYQLKIWDCDHPSQSENTQAIIKHLQAVLSDK